MKTSSILLMLALTSLIAYAQNNTLYKVTPVGEGLYHLYYDTSTAKSTIVEFKDHIALLEVPVINEGGGATKLRDNVMAGNRILETLKKEFPKKQLKYVLHSHWHPHSLSSISPFLLNDVVLISTRTNFERLKNIVDASLLERSKNLIKFIEADSFVLEDKTNKIIVHRFLKSDYPSTPTEEYLYFYLPKYKALHSGCMYNRWMGEPIDGRELLTSREVDLNQFLLDRNIEPSCFIRSNGDKTEENGMIAYEKFVHVITNGITGKEIQEKFLNYTDDELINNRDEVLKKIINARLPASMINGEVYAGLRTNKLTRSLQFAHLQVLLNPSDANAWDTLGEVYYFLGNKQLAKYYEDQVKKINKDFSGGEAIWKKDLEEFSKNW